MKDFTIAFTTWVIILIVCIAVWVAVIFGIVWLIKELF